MKLLFAAFIVAALAIAGIVWVIVDPNSVIHRILSIGMTDDGWRYELAGIIGGIAGPILSFGALMIISVQAAYQNMQMNNDTDIRFYEAKLRYLELQYKSVCDLIDVGDMKGAHDVFLQYIDLLKIHYKNIYVNSRNVNLWGIFLK